MIQSLYRIKAIAANTLTEALRQRVLGLVVIGGVVFILSSFFITDLSVQLDRFKLLKDMGYASLSLTGLVVALLAAAQLIPGEIERRTLYTTLSKPVWRFEYVLGKYLGLVGLITIITVVLALFIYLVLIGQEMTEICFLYQVNVIDWASGSFDELSEFKRRIIAEVQGDSRDIGLFYALMLVWAKLCVLTGIAVFFSTMASSTAFIIWNTLLVMLIGHLQHLAKMHWLYDDLASNWLKVAFVAVIGWLVPDFELYNLIDDIIAGKSPPWNACFHVLLYSFFYVSILMVLASLIFEEREL